MAFPEPETWNRETADISRENAKRKHSPCSFFFSHGWSLCLAAKYFHNGRLAASARGGVALKHRHKIQLALFGQLMASFEYMLKDFVAQAIDATDTFDQKIKKQEWLNISTDRVLSQRVAQSSIGAMLVHPTLGWHVPETVNERYSALFNTKPIDGTEIKTLSTLWVLRHSVAHNAGFVTANDAARIGQPALSEQVVEIDGDFIDSSFDFLCGIARRVAEDCGRSVLAQHLRGMAEYGPDYARDGNAYRAIKLLGTYIESRNKELPEITEAEYTSDWAADNG